MKNKLFVLMGIVLFSFLNFASLYNSTGNNSNTIGLLFEFTNATADIEYNPGDRLKEVDCTCTLTGKTGRTLRCKIDGKKELCTETQQGSGACYSSWTGGLLCEGSTGITFGN